MRILEKKANWRPKNDHTHSLISLCTCRSVFMPHRMQGSEEPRDQRNLSRPSPAVRKSERGRSWLREAIPLRACAFYLDQIRVLTAKSVMAEAEDPAPAQHKEGDDEETPGYKAPAKVDLETIKQMDADDESLVKYKQALLGNTGDVPKGEPRNILPGPFYPGSRDMKSLHTERSGPNVVVEKFSMVPADGSRKDFDLTGQ